MKKTLIILALFVFGPAAFVNAQQQLAKNQTKDTVAARVVKTYNSLPIADANKSIGKKNVMIMGTVYGTEKEGDRVLAYLGGAYPNQLLTVILSGKPATLESQLPGKLFTALGDITAYNGKAVIEIKNFSQLIFTGKKPVQPMR